jgi:hypothetical protein
MTHGVDPVGERRAAAAAATRAAPSPPQAARFASAWSQARRRAQTHTPAQPDDAPQSSLAPQPEAMPVCIAPAPGAAAARPAPPRVALPRSVSAANAKAATRLARVPSTAPHAAPEGETTIEPGWPALPGVRLVLRALGFAWHVDWLGPRPHALTAHTLAELARRLAARAFRAPRNPHEPR